MGTVLKAIDRQTQEAVAVKVLKQTAIDANPGVIERFRREGEALRELNHPNIVKMLEMLQSDDSYYLIMEYLPGGDLRKLLQRGPLPIHRVLELALDLADALTRAHRLDIVHRDLKPANVLLAADGSPRLTDFGVARIGSAERVTATGTAMGTMDYLPPELLEGRMLDHRADIWSFGVMLFEMTTGRRPFYTKNIADMLVAIASSPIPNPELLRPDAPVGLVDLIYRMLERDLNTRIPSVRYIGAALEDILYGREPTGLHLEKERFKTPQPLVRENLKMNLPTQVMAFVGREAELSELSFVLADSRIRLITVLAPGGMGKTRLAVEAAGRQRKRFEDGVFFVDLAHLTDRVNIIPAVAESLYYSFEADGRPQKEQVLTYLGNKHLLLIMDNYEHLLPAAGLVTEILEAAPQVKILVTSRERLNIGGEHVYSLTGLEFPDWETPDDALEYAAVKLFVNSARRIRPDFQLEADDLTYLARICRLVAGMPLAIVLAATWVESLALGEIAEELHLSMGLLSTDLRDIATRQRSIKTVFDQAWTRLDAAEQAIFMSLCIFRGGFTRQAAQSVTHAPLATLNSLVSKALLRRDAASGRYEIHELLRQYGEAKLALDDQFEQNREAHARYYLELVHHLSGDLLSPGQKLVADEIEADFENIQAAWNHAVQMKQYTLLDSAVEGLEYFSHVRLRRQEIIKLFTHALEDYPVSEDSSLRRMRGRLLARYGSVAREHTPEEAETALREALAIARSFNHSKELAFALLELSRLIFREKLDEARLLTQEAQQRYERIGDRYGLSSVLFVKGYIAGLDGDIEMMRDYTRQSLEIVRETGNKIAIAATLGNLGYAYGALGDMKTYRQYATESIDIYEELGQRGGEGTWIGNVAVIDLVEGDFEAAHVRFERGYDMARHLNNEPQAVQNILLCAGIEILEGHLAGAKNRLEQARNFAISPIRHLDYLLIKSLYHCAVGEYEAARDTFQQALEIPNSLSANPIRTAGLLIMVGLVLPYVGDAEQGVKVMAVGLSSPWGWGHMEDRPLYKSWLDYVKDKLGQAGYESAWQQGKSLDMQQVAEGLFAGGSAG